MKIEDCKTVPEFFGVEMGFPIWIGCEKYFVQKCDLCSLTADRRRDSQALVGCLTGQLKWSRHEPSEGEFGSCAGCGYEFNSELISEYEITHCPKCGRKIGEATEEIIVPAMTAEEENILREIAAWFPWWSKINLDGDAVIRFHDNTFMNYPFGSPFSVEGMSISKAYEVLAPILEKYGEINLDEYRESN